MESVVEEAFEVQVLQPFHGWVVERFCDRSGNTYGALTAAAARVRGRDDKLNGIAESPKLEIGVLPSAEWKWSHPWLADSEYTQCDDEGWTYGSSIARINSRLAEGTSKCKREYYHFLRRRRCFRTRVRTPLLADELEASSPTSLRGASETRGSAGYDRATNEPLDFDPSVSAKRFYLVHRDPLKSYFRLSSSQVWTRIEFSNDDVMREGWLGQRGLLSHSWKLRYFLLLADSSSLVILRDRASMVQVSEVLIDRHTSLLSEKSVNQHQYQFLVINGDHTLRLNAVDGTSRARWMSAISELIVRSRASFNAGDESESNLPSTRSRSYRRLRSSTEDDVSTHSASMFNDVTSAESRTASSQSQSAWRPYRLLSSTMQSKRTISRQNRKEYLERFSSEIEEKIDAARSCLEQNVAILEENFQTAEEFLSSAVASVPKSDLEKLRVSITEALHAFSEKVTETLAHEDTNVLTCNMLSKDLYLLTKEMHDKIQSFVAPPTHETIKKIIVESPTRRRIPMDWFTESTDYPNRDRLPLSMSDDSTVSSNTTPSKYLETSYASASSLEIKKPGSRSFTIPESHATTEFIKVKAYKEIPEILTSGHYELPSGINGFVVKVHDKDVGSLIGFTLCSKEYVDELEAHFGNSVKVADELKESLPSSASSASLPASTTTSDPTVSADIPSGPASAPTLACVSSSPARVTLSETKKALFLKKLESNDVQHTDMKFSFESATSNHEIRCITFFAAQFHALRALTLPGNLEFLNSIVESNRWDTSGGKSGAFFAQTHDKRYVLKGISVTEFNMFVHMAPKYFKFMAKVIETDSPTIITKIVGLYKISHSRRLLKHTEYVVAMENFSYGYPPGQMYDLKGIFRRRYNQGDRNSFSVSNVQVSMNIPVLLDGNLAERIPVPVSQADLDVIESAIQNDTQFLCRAGVIDYSILLRFDEDKRRVVVGLIDYLHQFDFLKKMESTSKASLTFRNPTVISPLSYRRRFMNAMHRYFFGIERELEVRVRRRATTSAGKLRSRTPLGNGRPPSTPEAEHSGIVKQLALNLELAGGSEVTSTATLPLRRATRSDMSIPKYETRWTSEKPRGHSISSSRRPCFTSDGKPLRHTTTHSDGDDCSPLSSGYGEGGMEMENSFYSNDLMKSSTEEGDEDEAVGLPLSLSPSSRRNPQQSR